MPISAHTNFGYSTLATPPSGTGGTSLTVASGTGALFPAAPFNATIWPADAAPVSTNAEIVRVTAKATDTFTITRAQEGTSARTHLANAQIAAGVTARVLTDIEYGAFGIVCITDPVYGAVGDGDSSRAAANVTAIRAAMADAVANNKSLYIPAGIYRVNDNFTFDGDWSGLTVFGDGPSSCIKVADTLDEDANVEAGWTIILDGASNGALENFTLRHLMVDGNRASLTGFDVANTTVGIVGYQDSSFHNVQVESCWAVNYKQGSGFFTYAGGIRFVDCHASGNEYHGLAVSRDTNFGDADKWAEVVNLTAHDNDGYGLDAGRYCRTIVENLNAYYNVEGGMKFSIGTEALIVRGARLAYNLGPGFQDTDTVGNAILDLDGIVTHNNGGIGFRLVSGSSVRIGSITSYDNYCRTGASRSGFGYTGGSLQGTDILIGTGTGYIQYFTADSLRSSNSPAAGILFDGNVRSYLVRYMESRRSSTFGFYDATQQVYTAWAGSTAYVVGDIRSNGGVNYLCTSAHTSAAGTEPGVGGSWTTVWKVFTTDAVVLSGLFVENNQAGTAASGAAAAFACERAGGIKVNGLVFRDNQATTTQHSALYFTSGADAFVENCHFGSGIAAGSECYTATAGTRVRFGDNNTGTLVTRARGTMAADGGSGTASVTFPTAMSNLGGAVYFAQAVPASVDAAVDWYVSTANRTTFTITKATGSFAAGTGNVSVRYDVQMEIQR